MISSKFIKKINIKLIQSPSKHVQKEENCTRNSRYQNTFFTYSYSSSYAAAAAAVCWSAFIHFKSNKIQTLTKQKYIVSSKYI